MKNLLKLNLFAVLMLSVPAFAVDGMAVIDMRTAVFQLKQLQMLLKLLKKMLIMHLI